MTESAMMCSPQVKNVIFIYTRGHRGTTRKIAGKHNYEIKRRYRSTRTHHLRIINDIQICIIKIHKRVVDVGILNYLRVYKYVLCKTLSISWQNSNVLCLWHKAVFIKITLNSSELIVKFYRNNLLVGVMSFEFKIRIMINEFFYLMCNTLLLNLLYITLQ